MKVGGGFQGMLHLSAKNTRSRGIYFIDPNDKVFKYIMKKASRK